VNHWRTHSIGSLSLQTIVGDGRAGIGSGGAAAAVAFSALRFAARARRRSTARADPPRLRVPLSSFIIDP
jgi:hypothetical protein